jgi:RNA polymerase sigma-70 factor (ECF subfamily)
METCWPEVLAAHAEPADDALPLRRRLVRHYSEAVHQYLLGAVRDPDTAAELSQEFALRLLRGDFQRADPRRGRFRDYLKSVLVNLVNKHFRQRQRLRSLPESAAAVPAPAGDAPTFEECLRDQVLARTWRALEDTQPRYHAVLLSRAEQPSAPSAALAERLTAASGESWTAAQVRKTLERARALFVDLLLKEVSSGLRCPGRDGLAEALEELDLLKYCRGALERCAPRC